VSTYSNNDSYLGMVACMLLIKTQAVRLVISGEKFT